MRGLERAAAARRGSLSGATRALYHRVMRPDPAAEARLFGKLSLRGVLKPQDVAELFKEARASQAQGQPTSLSSLALRRGLIDKDRLLHYFHTDGEEAPELPGYAYVRKLGEGGTANVFLVRKADGSEEALKVLHEPLAAQPETVKSFLSEAKLLESLEHANVVKGHRAGRFAGRYLSFMEFVDGRTLQEMIAQGGAFDEDGALYVILQVARALEYLRGQGIVHRDIKPGNILVTAANEVKVIDLGFASAPHGGASGGSGTTRGTAAFLSPEQAMGRQDLDVRSDIYSLGATLYQMVLGELPFEGDDEELVQKAVLAGLSAEKTKGGRISHHMHYFIEKMMAKEREVRYQDPQELMSDIENQIRGKKTATVDDSAGLAEEAEMRRLRLERLRRKREGR